MTMGTVVVHPCPTCGSMAQCIAGPDGQTIHRAVKPPKDRDVFSVLRSHLRAAELADEKRPSFASGAALAALQYAVTDIGSQEWHRLKAEMISAGRTPTDAEVTAYQKSIWDLRDAECT